MSEFLNDLRFGLRQLTARPGFATAAIITLALGIGANTAVFSVLNGYLLKPLPYPQGGRLVSINESYPDLQQPYVGVSVINYLAVKKGASALSNMALYARKDYNLTANGRTERVTALRTRSSLFDVLRAKPYLGRVLGQANDRQGRDRVAVLSYGLWQRMFGGDPKLIGRTVKLNGTSYRITGVMPRGFQFPDNRVGLWVPFYFTPQMTNSCWTCELDHHVIGRLKPGATLLALRAQLNQAAARVVSVAPAQIQHFFQKGGWNLRARSYRNVVLGDRTPLLLILQGFVLLLLLMTCVNVANLLLARILGRTHEIAMRAALGAGRFTLIRQLFVEGLCLAIPGGLVGVALGWLGLSFIQNVGLGARLGVFNLTPDWRVGLFALGMVIAVSIVISFLPIRQLARNDLQTLLQAGGRAVGGGRGAKRMRAALVVAEIALAAALLGGTGLLVNSFLRLQSVSPGFNADRVLTADVLLPGENDAPVTIGDARYYDQLLRRVRALPGVKQAGLTSAVPIQSAPIGNAYAVPGFSPTSGREPSGNYTVASAGYFKTLGIPLLRGRLFGAEDTPQSQPVIIIDKKLADIWFPHASPIGHQMTVGGVYKDNKPLRFTIVGEVATVRSASLDQAPQVGTYYIDALQLPRTYSGGMSLVVKTVASPYGLARPLKQVVHDLNPLVSISNFTSMDDVLAASLAAREAVMVLVLVFACIGLALAAVGVYGVLSYVVGQRRTECGVRLAVGALPGDLLWLIIRDGLRMLTIGLAAGLGLAVVLGYAISSQLFNVMPFDPATLAGVVVVLSAITLVACYLPARRAAKLDPAVAIMER